MSDTPPNTKDDRINVRYAEVGGLRLAYETFGDPQARPLLLIMGLASQMLIWDEVFCQQLADRGHYVIRFDNRDVGLSSRCSELGRPNIFRALFDARLGRPVRVAYTLDDFADDTVGLLDALGIERAHLVGASMGGMIAQVTATRHPERVASLTSAMSTTGNPRLPLPQWKAIRVLIKRPPSTRDAFIDYTTEMWRTIGSPGYPFETERVRQRSARIFDRGIPGWGSRRQLTAVIAQGDRRPQLAGLRLPSLILHGRADPLVPVAAGIDTAESIPGAELMLLDGVGHNLPKPVWPQMIDALTELTERAE